MSLHLPTLTIVQACVTVLTCLIMVAGALILRQSQELRLWAGGNVLVGLGFAMGATPGSPDWLNGVLSYSTIALGLALTLRGLLLFSQRHLAGHWIILWVVLATAIPAYFLYVQPGIHYRQAASYVLGACISLASAAALLVPAGTRTQAAMRITAAFFGLLGLSLLAQGSAMLLRSGPLQDPDYAAQVNGLVQLLATLAQIGLTSGLMMMVAYRYADQLQQLSVVDGLTGVLNRTGLEKVGRRTLQRAARQGLPVALAMLDADHFKKINDRYGHPAGDEVLRHLADTLLAQVRPQDLVARFGGEEFVLVFPGMDTAQVLPVLERLRALLAEATVAAHPHQIRYTVSIGVASSSDGGHAMERLIELADAALYQAKSGGRNRVFRAGATDPSSTTTSPWAST